MSSHDKLSCCVAVQWEMAGFFPVSHLFLKNVKLSSSLTIIYILNGICGYSNLKAGIISMSFTFFTDL